MGRLAVDLEQKIARARVPGLVRAIASADNRAAVARARGAAPAAAAAEEEARALRAELARVGALAEGREPEPVHMAPEQAEAHRDVKPGNGPEDAGAAAEEALRRLAGPRGRLALQELRHELAEEVLPPGPVLTAEAPLRVPPEPPPEPALQRLQVLPIHPAAPRRGAARRAP